MMPVEVGQMAASLLKTASEIDRLARHPDWQVVAPSFPHVMTGFADRLFQESLHLNEMRLCGLPRSPALLR